MLCVSKVVVSCLCNFSFTDVLGPLLKMTSLSSISSPFGLTRRPLNRPVADPPGAYVFPSLQLRRRGGTLDYDSRPGLMSPLEISN